MWSWLGWQKKNVSIGDRNCHWVWFKGCACKCHKIVWCWNKKGEHVNIVYVAYMINKSKSHHDKKKMVAIEMVDGLILEGKDKEFYVGYAYGNNHRKQFPWKGYS